MCALSRLTLNPKPSCTADTNCHASVLLQVALTLELQRRLGGPAADVRCFAADPGEVLTDITRTLPGPLRWAYRALLPRILFTPAQGEVVFVLPTLEQT